MTKYGFEFAENAVSADRTRLINQMWKLIPMKEKEENWEGHLQIVIQEIAGLSRIYCEKLDYLILLSKLEGLFHEKSQDFMIYRKTVFRCIELLSRLMNDE